MWVRMGQQVLLAPMTRAVPKAHAQFVTEGGGVGLERDPAERGFRSGRSTLGLEGELRAQGVTGIRFTVMCPDGMLTPMITDVIDDPAVAMTFTGLRPVTVEEVAAATARALRKPRRVVSVPHWRGAQVRVIGMVPDVVLRAAPVFRRLGLRQQSRMRRRLTTTPQ